VVIVRILHEGQFDLDDHVEELEELDASMLAALESGDEEQFRASLDGVLAMVREHGKPIDDPEDIRPSDLVVPAADATLDEVRSLLASEDVGED
jgi:hypothetical protein